MTSVPPTYSLSSSSAPMFPSPGLSMPMPVHYGTAVPPESYYLGTAVLTSTIPPSLPDYSPNKDVIAIRDACHGFGTHNKDLIKLIVQKTSKQMQVLEFAYKNHHQKELIPRLKSETSGTYKTALVLLASGPLEGDAYALSQALKKENAVLKLSILAELVIAKSKADLALFRNYLLATKQIDLEDVITRAIVKESETILSIFKESLKPELPVEPLDVEHDFFTLKHFMAGNRKQINAILPVLLSRPLAHINQLAEKWRRETFNTELAASISLQFNNEPDVRDLLLYALGAAESSQGYGVWRDAQRIEDAISSKNQEILLAIRIIRAHWDGDRFKQVIATCDNIKPGKGRLVKRVESATTNNLEYLLVRVIKNGAT